MTMEHVRVVEMGPRGGLQNEKQNVPTATRLELIQRLTAAGLRDIEVTPFVSPKWVPQMADQAEVMCGLQRHPGVIYPVLTPKLKGFEAAVAAGAAEVADAARRHGIKVRGYVSCVVACPCDGPIAPSQVAHVAARLHALGCYEVSLGDTIGVGTPASLLRMLEAVAGKVPMARLAGHYHDTYGMAVANVHASYDFGLRVFDSAAAGLGGCPDAKGATGNVATEDLVYLLHGLGAGTGVDLDALVDCGAWISAQLGRGNGSRVGRAVLSRRH